MPTKVVNRHFDQYDVYGGRGAPIGNPFSHKNYPNVILVGSREEALSLYKEWFDERLKEPFFRQFVLSLKGKRIACSCRPKDGFRGKLMCHCQIVAGWLDGIPPDKVD